MTIIRLEVLSNDIAKLPQKQFKTLTNYREIITNEIHKIVGVDSRLIELLLPQHTKYGVMLTFHIRCDATASSEVVQLIRKEAKSNQLAKVLFVLHLYVLLIFVLIYI